MNYSEILELLHAGFNADEIRSMINSQNPQNNPQEPTKQEPDDSKFNQLNETMGKILSAIQAGNLARNSFENLGTPSDINNEVDKIMSGLIRPEMNKKQEV